jgi:hypothetical protein
MVINHTGVTTRGEKALEFSDLVSGTDVPGEKLTESPLGLLLGVTVFALHKRGISLRAACGLITHATTTSVLQNFLAPHYGSE